MWSEKHKPSSFKDFVGNPKAVAAVRAWASNWKREPRKALMILGPSGTGKTLAAELLAKEMDYNIIETNASDVRSKKALENFFGRALEQQSLFYKGKLVLLDELEGVSGQKDRGAPAVIKTIIESSRHPIILTAADQTAASVKTVRRSCKVVKLEPVPTDDIVQALERVCSIENIKADEKALKAIARFSGGDVRAAINDMQSVVNSSRELKPDDVKGLGYRDSARSVQEGLTVVFRTLDAGTAIEAVDNLDVPPDEFIQWVRENIPREYKDGKEIAVAFDMLSRADIFRGRIMRQQYWRFLVYQLGLSSAGVAVAKEEKYPEVREYRFPSRIALLARTMFQRAKDKKNAEALASVMHCSSREARAYFPLIRLIKNRQPRAYQKIVEETGVDI